MNLILLTSTFLKITVAFDLIKIGDSVELSIKKLIPFLFFQTPKSKKDLTEINFELQRFYLLTVNTIAIEKKSIVFKSIGSKDDGKMDSLSVKISPDRLF
jgi:hypothetical protein